MQKIKSIQNQKLSGSTLWKVGPLIKGEASIKTKGLKEIFKRPSECQSCP